MSNPNRSIIVGIVIEQLFNLGVHLVIVEEDLVGAHGLHQLDPLGKAHREVVGHVEAFHAHGELLLFFTLLQLVMGDF